MGGSGYDLGNVYGKITLDASGVGEGIRKAREELNRGFQGMGQSLQSFGDQLTGMGARITALSAPFTALSVSGIKTAADFDVLMKQIELFGGATGDELEAVRQTALQLGRDTKFSSQDAGAGMLELLKSGQSLEEALATIPEVLDLAAVGNMSLAEATGIATSGLAQFQLDADLAGTVVDALSRAASASRADVRDLGQALTNVGPIAGNFGLDVQETSAILGVFANNGIMGAEAGTQLKSMLLNMTRPTEEVQQAYRELGVSLYDTEGNLRDFNTVMVELDSVLDTLPVQQQNELMQRLGGSYGIVGLSALRASNGIGEMLAEMESAPEAGSLAEGFMDTFAGKVEGLKGSFETLKIEAFTPFMNEVAGPFVERLTEMVNGITVWASENPELTTTIIQIGSAIAVAGPALMGAGLAINNIGFAVKAVAPLFGLLTSPLGLIAGAGLVLAEVFDVDLRQAFEDVASGVLPALEEIRVWVVEEGFPAMVEFVQTTVIPLFERIGEAIRSAWEFIAPILGQMFNWFVTQGLPAISNFIRNTFIPNLQRIGDIIGQVWADIAPILAELFTWFVEEALPAIGEIIETVFIPLIEDIGTRIGEVWAVIEPVLRDLYNWFVTSALPAISDFIQSVFIPAVEGIAHIFSEIYQTVAPILQFIIEWFVTKGIPIIVGIINDVVVPAIGVFVNILSAIWNAVAPALQTLIDWFQTTGWPIIEGIINNVITPAIDLLVGILKGIWELVEPVINELVRWFNETIAPAINAGAEFVTTAIDDFIAIFTGIWDEASKSLHAIEKWFNETIAPIIDEARTKLIQPAIDKVIEIFTAIWKWAEPGLRDLATGISAIFAEIGRIINGIIAEILKIPQYIDEARYAIDKFLRGNPKNAVGDTAQQILSPTGFSQVQSGLEDPTLFEGRSGELAREFVGKMHQSGIIPSKDNGGVGMADMMYAIGRPQEDNEIFVPRTDGQFIPGFMDKMNALFDRENTPTIGQVVIHANTEEGGRAAARGFVDEFERMLRSKG